MSSLERQAELPFAGRVAIVTGGGTGIGAGITDLLAERGAAVVIGQPDDDAATALAAVLAGPRRDVRGVGADLALASGCAALIDRCLEMHGRIDILVNNAAITGPAADGELLEFSDALLDSIMDVNLKGVFRCSRNAARHMSRDGGVIVNIASVGAFAAQYQASAYVATKAGVVGLTRGMAFELAPLGVRVVAVAPGDIDTSSQRSLGAASSSHDETARHWWERRAPVGRRGSPNDIARAVAFLASDEASYVTGETLIVDGGWLAY